MNKRISPLVIFLLSYSVLSAQNLVPNPSFECGVDQCDPTYISSTYSSFVCDWVCPTFGTTDIFSTLITPKECYSRMPYDNTFPHLNAGSQLPRTGNRFAGIYTYSGPVNLPADSSYREYLQVKLKEPLVPGELYCGEMYVCRAENHYFAANNLGIAFHTTPLVDYSTFGPLRISPSILESQILTDTANWVKIGGIFQASQEANYLFIGNFKDNDNTQTAPVDDPSRPNRDSFAYYFIDDVLVEKMPYDAFTFSGNADICLGTEANITASVGVSNITWALLTDTATVVATGTTLNVTPVETTSYLVTAKNCHKTVRDTVTIAVFAVPHVDIGKDTVICAGTSLLLDAGSQYGYQWQDNSSGRYFNATQAGIYSATVSNEFNCKAQDEIEVSIKNVPDIDLGADALICDDFYSLHAGGGQSSYLWSTGATDSVFTPTEAGLYWLQVENECGISRDSVNIYYIGDIFIPNVLTLNGDTLNAKLIIKNIGNDIRGRLSIYNRWGTEIYSSKNYNNDWPADDDDLPSGVYFYYFTVPGCGSHKGFVYVIR